MTQITLGQSIVMEVEATGGGMDSNGKAVRYTNLSRGCNLYLMLMGIMFTSGMVMAEILSWLLLI